jgi:hypothetical protein
MGIVYKARQTKLNRVVALKMISAGIHTGEEELARFRTEAWVAMAVQGFAVAHQVQRVGALRRYCEQRSRP